VLESGHVSVKVIKMSSLAIDRLLILWLLHGSLLCCETDHETDCTNFLSLDMQDIESGQLRHARNSLRFSTVRAMTYEMFSLRLTAITRIHLITYPSPVHSQLG